jgi:hypothetical protein
MSDFFSGRKAELESEIRKRMNKHRMDCFAISYLDAQIVLLGKKRKIFFLL